MSKEEIDCEEFPEHEECKCSDPNDDDSAYDAWADDRVIEFYEALEERQELYKKLLSADHSTNNVTERDELEKKLVENLTGKRGLWLNMNSIHEWVQE
jgi:hypothetical protein